MALNAPNLNDLDNDDDEFLDEDEEQLKQDNDDDDIDDTSAGKEKLISQDKVNQIVKDRLKRQEEKLKAEYEAKLTDALKDTSSMKQVIDYLHDYGYKGSIEDISKELKTQVRELKKQESGMSDTELDRLDELEQLKKKVDALSNEKEQDNQKVELQAKQQKEFQKQVKDLEDKYGDEGITVDKLRLNKKFVEFNKYADPKLTLTQVYDLYIKMFGEAEAETIAKIQLNIDRSTDTGKKRKVDNSTYGLSKDEIELVDDHNKRYPKNTMTYKEFKQLQKRG